MKYYSIQNSWSKKLLGVHEPYKEFIDLGNVNNPKHSGKHFLGKIDFTPEIPILVLKDKACLLDLMPHPSTIGFAGKLVISSKFKSILEKNNITDFQFFPIELRQKNKTIENYWLMHPCKEHLEEIDFKRSEIYISGAIRPIKKIDIKSLLHFKQMREELGTKGYQKRSIALLMITNILIKQSCVKNILKLNHVRGKGTFFVNEILKEYIENEECTGIEFILLEVSKEEFFKENGYRHKVYGYWP